MSRLFLIIAAGYGATAVVLGAFAAHSLRNKLAENALNAFQTGVQYQFYHALALMLVAILCYLHPNNTLLKWSGGFFVLGVLLFSGSLYGLSLASIKALGPVTPLGGVSFILGWILLAIAAFRITS